MCALLGSCYQDSLGSASFDLSATLESPGSWTTMEGLLTGAEQAKGTVTLLVRPYCDLNVTVLDGIKLRNADG